MGSFGCVLEGGEKREDDVWTPLLFYGVSVALFGGLVFCFCIGEVVLAVLYQLAALVFNISLFQVVSVRCWRWAGFGIDTMGWNGGVGTNTGGLGAASRLGGSGS
jgi:hypothetical protein